MSGDFWQSDTYKIVKAMKATGNQIGLIEQWKRSVEAWAATATGPDAEAVKAWLPLWQTRSFYTAAELAPIFPMLALALGLRDRPGVRKSAKRLEHELDFAGLSRLYPGSKYFCVERPHYWCNQDNLKDIEQ